MKRRLLLASLSACATLLASSSVWAMAAPPCIPAVMTPKAIAIPANIPGFGYTALQATTNDVHLLAGTNKTPVTLTVGPSDGMLLKVAPAAPLTPGESYALEFSGFCMYGGYPVVPLTFTATAEAPLPTKLGDLQSGPTVTVKDFGTSQYTITASYGIAPEMKPWASVYELLVTLDGKLVATKPTFNASGDSVQVVGTGWCDGSNAANNKHTIGLRGRLAFAPTVDTALADSEFSCPAPKIGTPPNNGVNQPPGTTSSSSGGIDPVNSAGNGGSGASGCNVGHSSSSSSLAFIGAAFGLAALLRRRVSAASAAARRT